MTLSVKPYVGAGSQTIMTADEVVAALTPILTQLTAAVTALTLGNTKTDASNTLLTSLISDVTPALIVPAGREYEICPASTTSVVGTTGALSDDLDYLVVIPSSTTVGKIQLKDGAGTAFDVFAGGTLSNLVPFTIPCGMRSRAGAWSVITLAGATVLAVGNFS
jgi:hypothetical protein